MGVEPTTKGLKVPYATNCVTQAKTDHLPGVEPGRGANQALEVYKASVYPIDKWMITVPQMGVEPISHRLRAESIVSIIGPGHYFQN